MKSYPDASVLAPHMRVDASSTINVGERLHAHPAHVRPAPRTRHMVATPALLQVRAAPRTSFDPMLFSPPLKCLVPVRCVVLKRRAGQALVELHVARRADTGEAGGTAEDGVVRGGTVDRLAVHGRAIVVLLRPAMDVRQECSLEEPFFLSGGQKSADGVERNAAPARAVGAVGLGGLCEAGSDYLRPTALGLSEGTEIVVQAGATVAVPTR